VRFSEETRKKFKLTHTDEANATIQCASNRPLLTVILARYRNAMRDLIARAVRMSNDFIFQSAIIFAAGVSAALASFIILF
jgi:hypothetical protein